MHKKSGLAFKVAANLDLRTSGTCSPMRLCNGITLFHKTQTMSIE